jgi:uncharacterized protein YbjT (DUF2867 family)
MAIYPSLHRVALVAGATGLVGRQCLRLLSNDHVVTEVRAVVRRPLPPDSVGPRVRECRTDFDQLPHHPEWFEVDWVFCALGMTMRQAGSREAFRRVDYEYPLVIAKAALERGASHLLLVSALGANPRSTIFYFRIKGELEQAVQRLGYQSVTIARPSILLGHRQNWRVGEELGKRMAWLTPPRWRPVHAAQVASALVHAAHASRPGVQILSNALLRTYGPAYDQHSMAKPSSRSADFGA